MNHREWHADIMKSEEELEVIRKKKYVAQHKAKLLFLGHLTDEQTEQFYLWNGILCQGSYSKQPYFLNCHLSPIWGRFGYDVSRCRWPDKAQYYCSSTYRGIPRFDRLLTKKMLIENDERVFTSSKQNCTGYVAFVEGRIHYTTDLQNHSDFWKRHRKEHNLPIKLMAD